MSATRAGLDPEFATKLELFEKKLADNGIEGWELGDRQYFLKLQYLFQI